MTIVEDIRKTVADSTPVRAAVGATDLAVERVRAAIANAATTRAEVEARVAKAQEDLEKAVAGFDRKAFQAKVTEALDPKSLQAAAQQVPALAVSRALEVAGKAEARYESLAERGKVLLERMRTQKATEELIHQGKVTLSRTKAAVTTARKAVDETAAAAREAVGIARHDVAETVAETEQAVAGDVEATKAAAKRTATTARKRAAGTRAAAKGAATSARKTADAAAKAAEDAGGKIGD